MEIINHNLKKQYELDKMIYENNSGTTKVYEARDKSLGRTIILKSVEYASKNELICLEKEIKNQVLLKGYSDFVPAIHNTFVDEASHKLWIEMDKIQGISLREYIDDEAKLKKDDFWYKNQLDYYMKICSCMSQIHRLNGFIHKDLKPENIIINRQRKSAYIIDFGISGLGIGKGLGTEKYMAPEQRPNVKYHIVQATDVYALGQIAVEMFTGNTLKYGSDLIFNPMDDKWRKTIDFDSIDFGKYSGMRKIVSKALEMNPANRYQNAGKLYEAVKQLSYSNKKGK